MITVYSDYPVYQTWKCWKKLLHRGIIKIRIHKSVMDRVLDFCSYDHFTPDGDEHYIVTLPFIENEYYYNILLSFGDKCECLGPVHVCREMKRRIHNIAALYEKWN